MSRSRTSDVYLIVGGDNIIDLSQALANKEWSEPDWQVTLSHAHPWSDFTNSRCVAKL